MLTISQIGAILSLLLAFNVPQATVNNVEVILNQSKIIHSSPLPTGITMPVIESVTVKPAYTEQELKLLLKSRVPESLYGKKTPEYIRTTFPPIANPSSTSITFAQQGWFGNFGIIRFQNKDYTPTGVGVEITGLEPKTIYEYQFVWKEEGREDTVIPLQVSTTY